MIFANIKRTQKCSSFCNRTWTSYFRLQTSGHQTLNIVLTQHVGCSASLQVSDFSSINPFFNLILRHTSTFSTEIESFEYKGMESNCERQSGFCCLCLMRKVNICVRWQQRRLRMYFITSWRGEEKLTLAALKFLRVLHAVDNGKYSPHLGCQAERKRGSKDQLRLHSPVYC